MKKSKKILICLSICLLVGAGAISVIAYNYYSKFQKVSYVEQTKKSVINDEFIKEVDNKEETLITDNLKEVEGITNILLLGADYRPGETVGRTDSMMILTIDNVHKKIKTTSLMRDTYVEIPKFKDDKLNHSFAYGGVELLKSTIEKNFKVKIDNYVLVNFKSFKELIDLVGGVEVDVKEYEIEELNKYIPESKGKNVEPIKTTGKHLLNGTQALSYARIRYVGNGDYERTERQRYIVGELIEKLKEINPVKYPEIIDTMLPHVKTNMPIKDILNLAYTVYKIDNLSFKTLQIPVSEISSGRIYGNRGWVLLSDLEQDANILNDFIFEDIPLDKTKLDFNSFNEAMSKY